VANYLGLKDQSYYPHFTCTLASLDTVT